MVQNWFTLVHTGNNNILCIHYLLMHSGSDEFYSYKGILRVLSLLLYWLAQYFYPLYNCYQKRRWGLILAKQANQMNPTLTVWNNSSKVIWIYVVVVWVSFVNINVEIHVSSVILTIPVYCHTYFMDVSHRYLIIWMLVYCILAWGSSIYDVHIEGYSQQWMPVDRGRGGTRRCGRPQPISKADD
jgi:hypothetical protein